MLMDKMSILFKSIIKLEEIALVLSQLSINFLDCRFILRERDSFFFIFSSKRPYMVYHDQILERSNRSF